MSQALLEAVEKKVLSNGLTVLVHEDRSTPVVCVQMFVKVGSNHETDEVWGWSHGIEHLLFKGTERRRVGDIAREVRELGGTLNASTGYEITSYYIVAPTAGLETALDIHADVLMHSAFREDDLAPERGVLIEELRMYQDVPDGFGFTWDEIMKVAFTRHRYGRSIIGTVETLEKTPRETIVDYYRRGYVPENVVYVVAGDVDPAEAFASVERHFGRMPARATAVAVSPPEPEQDAFRYVALEGEVEKAYLKLAFHVPEESHADTPALRVLTHLLGSGRSSRLYRNVLERDALVSSIGLMEEVGLDPGVLVIDAVTDPDDVPAAVDAIVGEIARFGSEPIVADDLEKTVTNVIAAFLSALESVQGQAAILGRYEALGDHRLAGAYAARVAAVTAADVLRVARRWFSADRATLLTYVPGARLAPDRSGEAAMRARVAAAFAAREAGAAPAPPAREPIRAPEIHIRHQTSPGEITTASLPGGAGLVVRRRAKIPMVAIAVYGRAGVLFEEAAECGLGTLASRCLVKGTARLSDAEIAEELDRHAITIHPFSDRDTAGFYIEAMTHALDRALDLFSDILTEPAFPDDSVERERELLVADIAQEQDDTLSVTLEAFHEDLFGEHPYGRNPIGTETAVAALARERLRDWHRRFFVLENLSFSAVGDVSPPEIRDALAARIERLPAGPRPVPPVLPLRAPAAAERRIERDKAQSVIVRGVGAPSTHDEARYSHIVLNAVLSGMGARLFTELRDRRHLCYYAGSFYSPHEAAGVFGAYVGTSPERVEEAIDVLTRELERARRDGPDDGELARAVNGVTGSRLISLQRNGSQAAAFARAEAMGLGYRRVLEFSDRVRAVTARDVLSAAERTLRMDTSVLTVLTTPPGGGEAGADAQS